LGVSWKFLFIAENRENPVGNEVATFVRGPNEIPGDLIGFQSLM
jgi:hypothetical protein